MADNIKGIPFSSNDEGFNYPQQAINAVKRAYWEYFEVAAPRINVRAYIVFFTYTLGNWKALVSTDLADGRYYEVTFDKQSDSVYIDCYVKVEQQLMEREDLL